MEFKELAHRSNDGLDVALVWDRATDNLAVTVLDERSGAAFELVVETGSEALDAFRHPFAHAAWRGVDYKALGAAA
jgi:hypothetical protein